MIIKKLIFTAILLFSFTSFGKEKIEYITVAGDNINLREQPSLESKIIMKLKITSSVRILKKSNKIEQINNKKGQWIFVDTDVEDDKTKKTIKGWIFDYYVAYEFRFKKIQKWNYKKFESCIGDSCVNLTFKKDGSFINEFYICADGNCRGVDKIKECEHFGGIFNKKTQLCYTKGHLYNYLNLFLAKSSKQYIYFTKEGKKLIDPFSVE
jgi:uncharacterized protein YgiM (DUF1202 family)